MRTFYAMLFVHQIYLVLSNGTWFSSILCLYTSLLSHYAKAFYSLLQICLMAHCIFSTTKPVSSKLLFILTINKHMAVHAYDPRVAVKTPCVL